MSTLPAQLPIEVRSYLGTYIRRRRTQGLVHALGRAVVLTLGWVALVCAIDRLVGLPPAVRVALLAVNVSGIIAALASAIATMVRQGDPCRAATEVERREPAFAQRLETVTSRLLGPVGWRGSDALMRELTSAVAAETRSRRPAPLLPWWPALRPFALALMLAGVTLALGRIDWLDLPTLLRRYALPGASIAPVTSTRLDVSPGNTQVPEGETLRVLVKARRLGDAPPLLHARDAGQSWTTQVMSPGQDGQFEARLRSVERDIEYFVTGGDARSESFVARLLPRPAIVNFRVRYVYPPYTGLPTRELRNSDGLVEAPVGTEVTLTIEATEPLGLAIMTIGGEGVRMASAGPSAQVARFVVRDDRRYAIRMASSRGVSGAFRGGTIRAIPDRPPIVRLRGPSAIEAPFAGTAPIAFIAVDDYALARLDAELFIVRSTGGTERRSVPVPIARTRNETATFDLDLAPLGVQAGDVIELRVRGEDRAGQFDLTDAVRLAVTRDTGQARAGAPGPTAPPASNTVPLDPPGFGEALRAYFDAMRRR